MLIDFLSFFISLSFAFRFHSLIGNLLQKYFSITKSISLAIGFLLTAIIVEGILAFIITKSVKLIPEKVRKVKILNLLAPLPAIGEAIVIISFVLLLIVSLPFSPKVKKDISDSKSATYLIGKTQKYESGLKEAFGGVVEQSISYLVIKPQSNETIILDSEVTNLTYDLVSEEDMFNLINKERVERGIAPLDYFEGGVETARAHAEDMWERKYFAHVSPEGKDVGDRLDESGITYFIAGENLALAPTVSVAHTGLMNSEGHRKNILDPGFEKVAVGVVDNQIYGKMFVQIFITE